MKSQLILSLSLILATTALAQTPDVKPGPRVEKGKTAAVVPPVSETKGEKAVHPDLVAKFFKAQAKALSDQKAVEVTPQFQAAQASSNRFQLVIQEMAKFCGEGYNLMIDNKTEDPACAPIPAKETPKDTKPTSPK